MLLYIPSTSLLGVCSDFLVLLEEVTLLLANNGELLRDDPLPLRTSSLPKLSLYFKSFSRAESSLSVPESTPSLPVIVDALPEMVDKLEYLTDSACASNNCFLEACLGCSQAFSMFPVHPGCESISTGHPRASRNSIKAFLCLHELI